MKLSVCTTTYNQERYIAQAIDGFLMQKTTFPFEIVIGEDCSTDKTREICIEYQKKYPGKIRLLLREKNLGMMQNFIDTYNSCSGQYIALCEGDDYWTDPLKLQKQVDFLDSHPDYTISSHNVKVVYEEKQKKTTEWLGKVFPQTIDLEYLLRHGSGGATCSLVFRNRVFGDFPSWFKEQRGGDWSLQILCASKGYMKYFPEPMGVYRKHTLGSMYYAQLSVGEDTEKRVGLPAKNSLALNGVINKHFGYKYDRLIRKQNIYWYKLYVKEYLKRLNLWGVLKYLMLIIKAWFV